MLLVILFLTVSIDSQTANKNNFTTNTVTLATIKQQFKEDKYNYLTDCTTWYFRYYSLDKSALQKFADDINSKENFKNTIFTDNGKYCCDVRNDKTYTAETLYKRMVYLNEFAKRYKEVIFMKYGTIPHSSKSK